MKKRIEVHAAEEGGFWAEVPEIPGCASQGETLEELGKNLQEAVDGCLAEDTGDYTVDRRRLFDGLTMEEILAAFRRGEGARPSDA
jgi:predicted RNase H-like HicB family nuclease